MNRFLIPRPSAAPCRTAFFPPECRAEPHARVDAPRAVAKKVPQGRKMHRFDRVFFDVRTVENDNLGAFFHICDHLMDFNLFLVLGNYTDSLCDFRQIQALDFYVLHNAQKRKIGVILSEYRQHLFVFPIFASDL